LRLFSSFLCPHYQFIFFFLLTTRSFPVKAEFGRKHNITVFALMRCRDLSCVFVMRICGCVDGRSFLFFFFCVLLFFLYSSDVFIIHFAICLMTVVFCIEFVLLSSSDRRWSNETQIIMNATHQFMFGFTANTLTSNCRHCRFILSTLFFPFTLRLYSIQLIQIITN